MPIPIGPNRGTVAPSVCQRSYLRRIHGNDHVVSLLILLVSTVIGR